MEYSLYLKHHGILGQKWGVRRFQNKDGSLTAAGKERYYSDQERSDLHAKAMATKASQSSGATKNTSHEFSGIKSDLEDASSFIKRQAGAVADSFNKADREYGKMIDSLSKDEGFKKDVMSMMTKELGGFSQVDDMDLPEIVVDDLVDTMLPDYASPGYKQAIQDFSKNVDRYYDNVKAITDDLVGSFKDQRVTEVQSSTVQKGFGIFKKLVNQSKEVDIGSYGDIMENTLLGMSGGAGVRYLNNHQEMISLDGENYEKTQKLKNQILDEWKKTT